MMHPVKIAALSLAVVFSAVVSGFAQGHPAGIASYYAQKFEGRKTATGEVFSNRRYTAASNTLKLNTYVKVTNLTNGQAVYVRINDRMAPSNKRAIDLSSIAADELRFRVAGTARVKVEVVSKEEGSRGILAQDAAHGRPASARL